MVKLTLTLFLSVTVALVACNQIPEVFKKPGTSDKKPCICRLKGCFDDTCEILHCICQRLNIEKLLKRPQSECEYPQAWMEELYEGVKIRCFCLDICKKICNPNEYIQCVKAAFSRWACYYDKLVRKYGRDPRFKHLSDDFRSLTAHCVNIDCKNNCVGNGRCTPYHRPACTKCLNEKLEDIAELLNVNYAKRLLHLHMGYMESYQADLKNCQCYARSKDQGLYQRCIDTAQEYMHMTCEKLANDMVDASNSYCSTESILTLITNAVSECSFKFELDGGYPEECYHRKHETKWGSSTGRSIKPTSFLSHGANCFPSGGAKSYVDTYHHD